MALYCRSRTQTIRRDTVEVSIGNVKIGGNNPIAVQSMTTTKTEDIDATVAQSRELIEAGCEIVRVTAPSLKAARGLKEIRAKLTADGFSTPLVADIHFLPKAAMEAVEHVEKVRINPGNFADYKKFKVIDYSDSAYEEEMNRLYDSFSPFIRRCKELGRAIRIGTNHGSLSDRIMNRYGDTPEGMVQSALEFIRISESHGFHDIVLSMKASNPKVMIAAYRLAVQRMQEEGMKYPLHLGVTEAGDGEDARVKSCAGIGALLADGLGDTLRVSLTENPVHEIPVGQELIQWVESQQQSITTSPIILTDERINFFDPTKREIEPVTCGTNTLKTTTPPWVAVGSPENLSAESATKKIAEVQVRQKDAQIEYWIQKVDKEADLADLSALSSCMKNVIKGVMIDLSTPAIIPSLVSTLSKDLHYILNFPSSIAIEGMEAMKQLEDFHTTVCIDFGDSTDLQASITRLQAILPKSLFVTASSHVDSQHTIGTYRSIVAAFNTIGRQPGLWLRCNDSTFSTPAISFSERLMEASIFAGSLLCEGIGNIISIEGEPNLQKATALGYNILQGARARISKTEYVACPSCGRTLFDLQSTTQKIRAKTNHLKGVTIAIMGCIVNGPGEMADADFGYVGGAPGKVNLYVGKKCVKPGIPEADAVQALIDLIAEHGKWVDLES